MITVNYVFFFFCNFMVPFFAIGHTWSCFRTVGYKYLILKLDSYVQLRGNNNNETFIWYIIIIEFEV